MSWPGRQPSGLTWNSLSSPRFSEKACTATNASFGRNSGSATSRIAIGSGAPGVLTMARMASLPQRGDRPRQAVVVDLLLRGRIALAGARQGLGIHVADLVEGVAECLADPDRLAA